MFSLKEVLTWLINKCAFLHDYPVSIPASADLNNYVSPGTYYCTSDTRAQGLSNCPTTRAFFLFVDMAVMPVDPDTQYRYRVQTIRGRKGEKWVRDINSNDSGATWTFSSWKHDNPYVVNNLTTTNEGYVLDARQGKTLNDTKVSKSGDTMTGSLHINQGSNHDSNLYLETDAYTDIRFFAHGSNNSNPGVGCYDGANGVTVWRYRRSGTTNSFAIFGSEVKAGAFKSVANNLTTTDDGSVLDARQGKTLNDNKLAKSGGTMTGNLVVNRSANTDTASVRVASDTYDMGLYAQGSSTATPYIGLYDRTNSHWVLYYNPATEDLNLRGYCKHTIHTNTSTRFTETFKYSNGLLITNMREYVDNQTTTASSTGAIYYCSKAMPNYPIAYVTNKPTRTASAVHINGLAAVGLWCMNEGTLTNPGAMYLWKGASGNITTWIELQAIGMWK